MPRVHCYYFCLEPTARKDTCMRTTSVTVMVILFWKWDSRSYLITLCLNFLLNIYEAHQKQHFERYPFDE